VTAALSPEARERRQAAARAYYARAISTGRGKTHQPRGTEMWAWPVCPDHVGAFTAARTVDGTAWHYCDGIGWHALGGAS
jgi:hypothetical protein